MKIIPPEYETSGKVSPGESHKGSENHACWQRWRLVVHQAWGPRARSYLTPSFQDADGCAIALGA